MLLAADTGISIPGTWSHQCSTGQELNRGVGGAFVPQQYSDECEEGADDDKGLVVHTSSQAAHDPKSPDENNQAFNKTLLEFFPLSL